MADDELPINIIFWLIVARIVISSVGSCVSYVVCLCLLERAT